MSHPLPFRVFAPEPSGAEPAHRVLFGRALAHANRFRDGVDVRPPWPLEGPALEALFEGPTPEQGEDGAAVIDALAAAAEPGLAAAAGPNFFGWVIGSSHPVGVAADMMTSAWGQNAGNHMCSPAAAAAERVAARWLLDILRLPETCSVGYVTGATMAGFVCLAAARGAVLRRVGWDVEARGLTGAPPVRVFVGADAHITIISALRYLGLGSRPTRVPTDGQGRMSAAALTQALAAGEGPAIVVAQAGQINTGAFDPFGEIAAACRAHGAWLHVDGAFGLWARAVPEFERLVAGLEEADSWSVDGHKWLQLPYDSGFAIVKHREAHQRAMSVSASYLPAADEDTYDPGQFVPELSRRARGFACWAMLKALGRDGIARMVRGHCAMTRRLAERLAAEPGIEVLNEAHLNQLVVAFGGDDELTRAVIARLRAENEQLALGAVWKGRWALRISIISAPLTVDDVDLLGEAIVRAWRRVRDRATIPSNPTTGANRP
ncbi:MAG TPA: pyridoxal-dependent decarboxylase [Caulobacteraceae bacterium]